MECSETQTAQAEPLESLRANGRVDLRTVGALFSGPLREHDAYGVAFQTAQREVEGIAGRCIEPLDVVDRHDERTFRRERPERRPARRSDGPTIRPRARRAGAEERDLQRVALRR